MPYSIWPFSAQKAETAVPSLGRFWPKAEAPVVLVNVCFCGAAQSGNGRSAGGQSITPHRRRIALNLGLVDIPGTELRVAERATQNASNSKKDEIS
jgi:hypothetical protein